MSQNDIIIGSPDGLLNDICHIIEAARQKVAINVNRELTLMYWSIGERINKEVLQNQRAEYGKQLCQRCRHNCRGLLSLRSCPSRMLLPASFT